MARMNPAMYVKISILFILILGALSCKSRIKEYVSGCNDGRAFKRVSFTHLVDSLGFYDKQYVEVSGRYQQGKDESGLFNDSLIVDKVNNKAIWVDFSQECPLYLKGTRTGFFDYDNNNGQLTPANNKTIIIRGEIDCNNKGHLKAYKGAITHISYVKF